MVKRNDVSWGEYGGFEGPYWRGTVKLERPAVNASFWDRAMWVVTQTEGGAYDAVNMYDQCVFSPGLIQLCELFELSTRLLRKFRAAAPHVFASHIAEMPGNIEFDDVGFMQDGVRVSRHVKGTGPGSLRALYLGGSTGKLGQWTPAQKDHARQVCAVLASMFADTTFLRTQLRHVSPLLARFVLPAAKSTIFPDGEPARDARGYLAAMQCAFLSFAGNLQRQAWEAMQAAQRRWQPGMDDRRRCEIMLHAMVTHGIGIWPHRYMRIRPHLSEQFGVTLPTLDEVIADHGPSQAPAVDPVSGVQSIFPTIELWQSALVAIGYDLGPAGADGIAGAKTQTALLAFETGAGAESPDGLWDPETADLLHEAVKLHDQQAAQVLTEVSRDAWGCIMADDEGALSVAMHPLYVTDGSES